MTLIEGQLWKMKDHYVQITRVGKSLVEYKLLKKPDQRAVRSQMGNHKNVEAYLKSGKAKLVM